MKKLWRFLVVIPLFAWGCAHQSDRTTDGVTIGRNSDVRSNPQAETGENVPAPSWATRTSIEPEFPERPDHPHPAE